MKIAWFTPFSKKSAIGRYSKYAAKALSYHADVDLLLTDFDDLHDTDLHKVYYQSDNILTLLGDYDYCVYNIGDYSGFHSQIYDVMQQHKGIVIVHDVCLHNFFREYYLHYLEKPDIYVDTMVNLYGQANTDNILQSALAADAWAKLNLLNYHMSELLYPHSLGIAVHSMHHAGFVQSGYFGPVKQIPLVYGSEWEEWSEISDFKGYDTSKINLLTVGMINPNKRIHSVISAIGSDVDFRANFNFTCIGSLDNEEYINQLRQQIIDLGLEETVKLLGYVEHDVLANYYKNADIILNLRYPPYDGASASLVEQMLAGKTAIVSDTGFYSEVPNDCVLKTDPYNEEESLKNILSKIMKNITQYKDYGYNAKLYAEQAFSTITYGKSLYEFICHIDFLKPMYSLTDLIGEELNKINVKPEMPILKTLSAEIERLFNSRSFTGV